MSIDLNKSAEIARGLPKRQRQVLCCLGQGLLAKETAAKLNISESTVRNTRTVIYSKLRVNNAIEAVRVAFTAGML